MINPFMDLADAFLEEFGLVSEEHIPAYPTAADLPKLHHNLVLTNPNEHTKQHRSRVVMLFVRVVLNFKIAQSSVQQVSQEITRALVEFPIKLQLKLHHRSFLQDVVADAPSVVDALIEQMQSKVRIAENWIRDQAIIGRRASPCSLSVLRFPSSRNSSTRILRNS